MRDYERSVDCFQRSIEAFSRENHQWGAGVARAKLSYAYGHLGRTAEAIAHLLQSIMLDPRDG